MPTAIGTYRTTEGTGPLDRILMRRDSYSSNPTDWGSFHPAPSGWAAFDRHGYAWRVTEAEAAAIDATGQPEEPKP